MPVATTRKISVGFSDSGAALTLSISPILITNELKANLAKRLLKKGIDLSWNGQETNSEVFIRVVAIDQGNQMLRYLLPFIAPAIMEVEGQIALNGSAPKPFHFTQKAQMGLFGGSAQGMLKVCAQGLAAKIAKEILRTLKV